MNAPRRLIVSRSPCLPKVIAPHSPSVPIGLNLFTPDGVEVSLLHVVKHRIGNSLIVQSDQPCCVQAIDGFALAHPVYNGVGGNVLLAHLDHFADRYRRLDRVGSQRGAAVSRAPPANAIDNERRRCHIFFIRPITRDNIYFTSKDADKDGGVID
jgi:hypothetical protein